MFESELIGVDVGKNSPNKALAAEIQNLSLEDLQVDGNNIPEILQFRSLINDFLNANDGSSQLADYFNDL